MKKKVRINALQGERPNTTIFVMSQDIRGLSTYESAKARAFIESYGKDRVS